MKQILHPEFPASALRSRRRRLARLIENGTALLFSGHPSRSGTSTHQPEVNTRYLCGWRQPGALLMLRVIKGRISEEILFCPRQHPDRISWEGKQPGIRQALANFQLQDALPFTDFAQICRTHLNQEERIFLDPAACPKLATAIVEFWQEKAAGDNFSINDIRPLLGQLRMIKSAAEITRMRSCASVAAAAVREAIGRIRDLENEAQLAALIGRRYAERGGQHAFSPIAAAGANACILHYFENNCRIGKNDLVLIDTGCELSGYTSDISRTVPAAGRFTPVQRKLYETVLAAQQAALAAVRPGSSLSQASAKAQALMRRRLVRMGIIKSSRRGPSTNLDDFFMHGIGHHIGMQVHDAVAPASGREQRLEPGMCITIEPGLYFASAGSIPAAVRNIGIRIEDTVVVTGRGCRILTAAAPKLVDRIEAAAGDD